MLYKVVKMSFKCEGITVLKHDGTVYCNRVSRTECRTIRVKRVAIQRQGYAVFIRNKRYLMFKAVNVKIPFTYEFSAHGNTVKIKVSSTGTSTWCPVNFTRLEIYVNGKRIPARPLGCRAFRHIDKKTYVLVEIYANIITNFEFRLDLGKNVTNTYDDNILQKHGNVSLFTKSERICELKKYEWIDYRKKCFYWYWYKKGDIIGFKSKTWKTIDQTLSHNGHTYRVFVAAPKHVKHYCSRIRRTRKFTFCPEILVQKDGNTLYHKKIEFDYNECRPKTVLEKTDPNVYVSVDSTRSYGCGYVNFIKIEFKPALLPKCDANLFRW